MRQIL
ncbi:hypothetical protein GASC598B02_018560 [Gilliamella apicola SCGC AB-598-B02]